MMNINPFAMLFAGLVVVGIGLVLLLGVTSDTKTSMSLELAVQARTQANTERQFAHKIGDKKGEEIALADFEAAELAIKAAKEKSLKQDQEDQRPTVLAFLNKLIGKRFQKPAVAHQ